MHTRIHTLTLTHTDAHTHPHVYIEMEGAKLAEPSVLILVGMNLISEDDNWMADSLLEADFCGFRHQVVNFHYGRRKGAVDVCVAAISSGRHSAVVVADLSFNFDAFELHLGVPLRSFVQRGGRAAFLTCEGLLLQPTLSRLFDTRWLAASYYRTTWFPVAGPALDTTFAGIDAAQFSAKACSVMGVPPAERLFTTNHQSTTQSLVMSMDNKHVGHNGENPEVCVAVHKFGDGSIAYFGDVNMEEETKQLVVAFCRGSTTCAPSTSTTADDDGLRAGAKVLIKGLEAVPKHNGHSGRLVRFDSFRGRWDVRLLIGGGLSVKPGNVLPLPEQRRVLIVSDLGSDCNGVRKRQVTPVPSLQRVITDSCGSAQTVCVCDLERIMSAGALESADSVGAIIFPELSKEDLDEERILFNQLDCAPDQDGNSRSSVERFMALVSVAQKLRGFVESGGTVVFMADSYADNVAPAGGLLGDASSGGVGVFGRQWRLVENYRGTFEAGLAARECLVNEVCSVCVKGTLMAGVPAHEVLYAAEQGTETHEATLCAAACARIGHGLVAYFSDENFEQHTLDAVAQLCVRAGCQSVGTGGGGGGRHAQRVPPETAPPAPHGQPARAVDDEISRLEAHPTLLAGTRVELHGLRSAVHLNGRIALVLGLNSDSGRLTVDLMFTQEGETYLQKVKETNLRALHPLPCTSDALHEMLAPAVAGCRVSIPSGKYVAGILSGFQIPTALTLEGNKAELHFAVSVAPEATGTLLLLSNFTVVNASLTVSGKDIKHVVLHQLNVSLPHTSNDDALTLNDMRGRILIDKCVVSGGSDSVFIQGCDVHLRGCHISGAASRGIFANHNFVIEDSVVTGCGGYGMKTRAGCQRRGKNSIQSGPWDGVFGGMGAASSYDGFGESSFAAYDQGSEDEPDDDDFDDDGNEDEYGEYGFTRAEEEELLCQGVKPWDEDAHDVLTVLGYRD